MNLISLLVALVVLGVVAWLAFWVLGQIGLPEPAGTIARVLIGFLLLLILLGALMGGVGGLPTIRLGGLMPLAG